MGYHCRLPHTNRHFSHLIFRDRPLLDTRHIPTVTEVTQGIKSLIEGEYFDTAIQGEVSQPKRSSAGHIYFTMKDSGAQMGAVIWRRAAERMGLNLQHGQKIIATGDIEVYAPHGRYQLIVSSVRQAGLGALQQAFLELKAKLEAEGLFLLEHKKQPKEYPQKIGIVTSGTSAAFQDMRSVIEKRWPLVDIHLYHAAVQGVRAAGEIAAGIEFFNREKQVDVMIVGRGGGSLEDLWPFNEEAVARAIFASEIPVISAVGHETDFSIADFVADVRAATPTQAATVAVPDINELRFYVDELSRRFDDAAKRNINMAKDRVANLVRAHGLQVILQRVQQHRQRIDLLRTRAGHSLGLKLANQRSHMAELKGRLQALDPNEPLQRGFARVVQNGKWIRKSSALNDKLPFGVEWSDGKKLAQTSDGQTRLL